MFWDTLTTARRPSTTDGSWYSWWILPVQWEQLGTIKWLVNTPFDKLCASVVTTSKLSHLNNLISVQPLAIPAPHLLSFFLAHQPFPHWKSQIAYLDNITPSLESTFRFIPSASPVTSRLTSSFNCHLCHHPHSHHPSLLHSFTRGSKPTFSTNPSHLNTPSTLDCLHDHETGPDLSCFSIYF